MEAVGGAAALQTHGQQDERRKALGFGLVVLEPFQQAEGEIEDIDALLFLQGLRIVPDVEESLLQSFRGQSGLEFCFRLPRSWPPLASLGRVPDVLQSVRR